MLVTTEGQQMPAAQCVVKCCLHGPQLITAQHQELMNCHLQVSARGSPSQGNCCGAPIICLLLLLLVLTVSGLLNELEGRGRAFPEHAVPCKVLGHHHITAKHQAPSIPSCRVHCGACSVKSPSSVKISG